MIKLVYCIRRRKDVPAEDFHTYWLEKHGPLVASVAGAIGAVRYVQSHTVGAEFNAMLRESRGAAEAYDGITEVWWSDEDSLRVCLESSAGQEAARRLIEDEARFIDFSRSRLFLTSEHVVFDAR